MDRTFPLEKFHGLRTPFYYYDTDLLRETLNTIRQLVKHEGGWHVHYAVKANTNPKVLKEIAQAGLGADCVSGGEMKAAHAIGIPAEKIVFAGVGKSDEEILWGIDNEIGCFNVESIPELEVINALAEERGKVANVAFRVNPNVDAHTHEKITTGLSENKFGIGIEDIVPVIHRCNELANVNYVGLHFHIGSQILHLDVYENLCRKINELQERLEAESIQTRSINVGGGLGIDYENPACHPIPDFERYFDIFRTHLQLRPEQELHFELGRSIVAQCGTLITKVLYEKCGHTKKFLILDGGMTELIRPAMYQAYHKIENLSRSENTLTETYDVVGPICESSDVFGKDVLLPSSMRGDFIALRSAGAYGEAMASTYNSRRLPDSYTAEDFG